MVHVTAFGKHPGWPDDIEDIGLTCDELSRAKRHLSTLGLGVNAASGAWDRLPAEQRLPGFRHVFVWSIGSRVLVGKVWNSRDGRGRILQPMIGCAAVDGVPAAWSVDHVLPALDAVEQKTSQTGSPELVRLAVGEARRVIEDAAHLASADARVHDEGEDLARRLGADPVLGPELEGLARVLAELERAGASASSGETRATNIRVPRGELAAHHAALAWVRLLGRDVPAGTPILALAPLDRAFVDVIVGEPRAQNLLCARTGEGALPQATQTPPPDPGAMERARRRAARLVEAPEPAAGASDTGGGPRRRIGMLLGVVLAGLLVAWWLWPGPNQNPPSPDPKSAPVLPAAPGQEALIGGAIDAAHGAVERLGAENAAEGTPAPDALAQRVSGLRDRAGRLGSASGGDAAQRREHQREAAAIIADAGAARAEAESELARSRDRLAAYLEDALRRPPVSGGFRRAWETAVRRIQPADGWAEAQRALAQARTALTEAESRLGTALRVSPAPVEGVSREGVERALDAAVRPWEARAGNAALAGGFAQVEADASRWSANVRDLFESLARASEQVGRVAPPDERDAQGRTLRDSIERVSSSPVGAEFAPVTGETVARLDRYARVWGQSDPGSLLADAGGEDGVLAPAAWLRLASLGWPAKQEQLAEASRLAPRVLAAARSRPDPGVAQRVTLATRGMWSAYVAGSPDGQAQAAAWPLRERFGIGPADEAALPGWARFNLARWTLLQGATTASGQDASGGMSTLREAAMKFIEATAALDPGTRAFPAAKAQTDRLTRALDPWGALDFAAMGPGSAGWTVGEVGEGGSGVTFTTRIGGRTHAVRFERLDSPAQHERATYLGAGEVSVGLFSDTVTRARGWDEIAPVVCRSYPVGGVDPRRGVRTWDWGRRSTEFVVPACCDLPSNGWMRERPGMAGRSYYPEDAVPAPPDWEQPMQYVSPLAAMYAARALGCRLPTAGEWEAAVSAGRESAPNLRDASWRRVYDAVRSQASFLPEWPGAGIFHPANQGARPLPQDDGAAAAADDGFPWFRRVSEGGGKFRDLTGNVREYVFSDSARAEGPGSLSVEFVRALLGDGTALAVVGSSALAPAGGPGPFPADPAEAADGFADVGFRLAFTADASNVSVRRMMDRLREAVDAGRWLDRPGPGHEGP